MRPIPCTDVVRVFSSFIKVSPIERFLEKSSTGRSRSSSRGSSPGRSPGYHHDHGRIALIDENVHGFKVNIKQEKKSKFSSIVLKLRGIEEVSLIFICCILFLGYLQHIVSSTFPTGKIACVCYY
jgi:hypothetical protein